MQNPNPVDIRLSEELETQRLVGLLTLPRFSGFRVSPVALVSKKVVTEFQLIQNLSYPKDSSLNDGISTDDTSVSYATV